MELLKRISPVVAIGSALIGNKPKPPAALPSATRDDAASIAAADDELRKRRGGAADILMGAKGAEAPLSGGKLVLGT